MVQKVNPRHKEKNRRTRKRFQGGNPTAHPQPTALKKFHGRTDINHDEPIPPQDDMAPPGWLVEIGGHALRYWEESTPTLIALGILTEIDKEQYAVFCQSLADYVRLSRQIRKEGEIIEGVNSQGHPYQMSSPLLNVRNIAFNTMIKLGDRFGMNPSARSRIKVAENKKAAIDDFLRLRPLDKAVA